MKSVKLLQKTDDDYRNVGRIDLRGCMETVEKCRVIESYLLLCQSSNGFWLSFVTPSMCRGVPKTGFRTKIESKIIV